MSQDKIWGYLVHLCASMWPKGDWESRDSHQCPDPDLVYRNCEKPAYEEKLFWDLMEYLPTQGVNTVLLDVGNALKYERHPDIAQKEGLTKDEMKAMCDRIRALGMTPVPKLNFSCGHNPWLRKYSRMVGTEEYYEVTRDCIDEVAEVFGYPAYFHLGLDEEKAKNLGGYGFRNLRASHIWWRDAHRLFDRCAHHNMRPWIWSDVYWHHPDEFKKNMPKDVLQSNWFYSASRGKDEDGNYLQPELRAYLELDELGYDQVPTPSTWTHESNIDFTFGLCKNELNPERFKGVLSAPWESCLGESQYLLLQEAVRFGLAKKKYFPEYCPNKGENP